MVITFQVHNLDSKFSVLQFSLVPNNTSIRTLPISSQDNPGTMPWKIVLVDCNMFSLIPSLCILSLYSMFMLLPLSISTLENFTLIFGPMNVGSSTKAYDLG